MVIYIACLIQISTYLKSNPDTKNQRNIGRTAMCVVQYYCRVVSYIRLWTVPNSYMGNSNHICYSKLNVNATDLLN